MTPAALLGTRRDDEGGPVELPVDALLRHVLALGSSGSGKTVFCKVVVEEAVRNGLPVIAVDPQGDLVSLALSGSDDELRAHGVDVDAAHQFRQLADVVVFTPASQRGIPLCADPVEGRAPRDPAEAVAARTRVATMVTSLLGYDPAADDGAGLSVVLDRCLADLDAAGGEPSLSALTSQLMAAASGGFSAYTQYLEPKKIRSACQRLARLSVGARRLLFQQGVPIDVEALLGLGAHAQPGRIRVAVVYLNTLHSQDDKDLIVATLADRLYRWMLANPNPSPQALFYIDEVAPFVPPVRKPACKEGLTLLFKQARKYGLCCLMATQNPGDVDYRAMGQFGTWALGRLSTRQDLKKIEPSLRSLAPDDADRIVAELPRLGPGELLLLSPDRFDAPVPLQTRWLLSEHRTLDETGIAEIVTDEQRARFAPLERRGQTDDGPTRAVVMPEARSERVTRETELPESSEVPVADTQPPPAMRTVRPPPPGRGLMSATVELPLADDDESAPDEHAEHIRMLATFESATAKEFAERTGLSDRKARDVLNAMVEEGAAERFKKGRSYHYWASSTGGRPDLAMPPTVIAVAAMLGPDDAEELAQRMARGKIFGILGDEERFEAAELVYRPLFRVDFEEKVPAPVLSRFLGSKEDAREGSVYLHAGNLSVLVLTPGDGIEFVGAPEGYASEVEDLDGAATFIEVPPGTLPLDVEEWKARADDDRVRGQFSGVFKAAARTITPVFVPLWRLRFSKGGGSGFRIVWIDAIRGKPVQWP